MVTAWGGEVRACLFLGLSWAGQAAVQRPWSPALRECLPGLRKLRFQGAFSALEPHVEGPEVPPSQQVRT